MTIHIERDNFSICWNFDPETDELTTLENLSNCVECKNFDTVQVLWEQYVSQPVNYGEDTEWSRLAERDAYFAGAFDILKRLEDR